MEELCIYSGLSREEGFCKSRWVTPKGTASSTPWGAVEDEVPNSEAEVYYWKFFFKKACLFSPTHLISSLMSLRTHAIVCDPGPCDIL
jgi:hypothetical protein